MKWTLPDGTLVRNSVEMKRLCRERGLDWSYFRRREQKGLARRRVGPRAVRLPADWRARLDSIFGPEAVFEFSREVPARRPAVVVVPNATDTKWWHSLATDSAAICGVRGRINYVDLATGQQLKGNPCGTLIHLFADVPLHVERFQVALAGYGWIRCPWGRRERDAITGEA